MFSQKPKLHKKIEKYRQGNLRTIAIDVTSKCMMNCPRCYSETFRHAIPIPLKYLGKALNELHAMGVYHYVLQGGEPIDDADRLAAIIGMLHPDESYINVVTNGYNMDRGMVIWLKELGVDKIAFSLDSGIESEHDANRLPWSYRRVMQGIEFTRIEGLIPSISTVVTHQSLHSEGFQKAYQYAVKKGIRMDVQIAEPFGKWDGQTDYLVTPEDSRYIKELQRTSPVLANGQRMINRDIYSGSFDHCPAGTEFMSLTVDGQLLPCNFLQFSLGNVRDRSVRSMRDQLLTSHWFDGKHPCCLCGEDREFIDKFIVPNAGVKKPMDAIEVFNLEV